MRNLKFPVSIANKIDSLITRFWWASSSDKGMHLVNTGSIQLPKGLGDLGSRSVRIINDTMLFKQMMRIHNNSQLLVTRTLTSTQGCFVCCSKTGQEAPQRSSWGRRWLLQAVKMLESGLVWKIRDGKSVRAVNMPWVNGSIPHVNSNQAIRPASRWMVSDFITDRSEWNTTLI